jgi:ATP-binding cassette subfamily B (MDR/TAP) protein 1
LANDPTQLQQLLGVNMALVLEPIFSLLGCIIIGFAQGWKLTLLTTLVALPIIIFSSYFRLGFELRFEQLNASVFAESSKFASEAIGAFRTVTSLTMENAICQRYEILLHDQAKKAFDKAKYSTLVFALSDGLPLACMALCFYYGGRLLSTHEYTAVSIPSPQP